ncbi:putative invertase inhibitor [Cucumis sativus]|uniref:Pectinesterase inhibitor domain-containing protein n=1 Tax=Cucumis sativus TaxID=3659 RepID=A0A0A0KBR8_CUCSA|nr:putative invertase inhibitor [Cucumis sativus]
MSSLSHSILPCLFLFMFFSNFPITQSSNNNNTSSLIYKTCKASSEQDPNISFNFCVTSLKPAATKHRHGDTSLRRLGLITIYLIRHNMSNTRHHIKKYLHKNKGPRDPFVKLCLTDCLELYSDAIPTVKQARKDYKAGRYADANLKISSVMDDCSTCEEGFKEKDGVISPLTNRNHNAFELSAIALSIINMLC